jgi:uncharacterized cupin superfamily protein
VRITNIHAAAFAQGEATDDEPAWRFLDLSGEHLGVRVEETPVGGTTSRHHYHTAEEEHVLVLEGNATLHLGEELIELGVGDHVWFPAGERVAHHIRNTSAAPFKYLVFGERKQDDVVFYPRGKVVLVKSAAGVQQYTYESREVQE